MVDTVIRNEWKAIRGIATPFTADPDWRDTNDIPGFDAASPFFIVPTPNASGSFELGLEFLDANGDIVIPAGNTRVNIQFQEKVQLTFDATVQTGPFLLHVGDPIELRGEEGILAPNAEKFKINGALQLVSTVSLPAGAELMLFIARYG